MADTTFIITPSGVEYSMVSDDFFSSLESNQYSESVSQDVALDWLLNIKKFCVMRQIGASSCYRGIYEATYDIEDFASYATPVTDLGGSYKEPQIGGSDSSISTGDAGEVMQTSPRNPHRYTLQEDENNSEDPNPPPSELTGEYLGAFFHHKGSWYSSFDDIAATTTDEITVKTISDNTKKVETEDVKKKIFVQDKFYPKGGTADIKECLCPCFFSSVASGGNEGFSGTFNLKRTGIETTLEISFQAYQIKDAITVTANTGETYSSGCIGCPSGSGSPCGVVTTLYLPNGAETISVVVDPICDEGQGTIWDFRIRCLDEEPP